MMIFRYSPAFLLWFFLGTIGAHHFYAGSIVRGVGYLVCLVAVFALPMFSGFEAIILGLPESFWELVCCLDLHGNSIVELFLLRVPASS